MAKKRMYQNVFVRSGVNQGRYEALGTHQKPTAPLGTLHKGVVMINLLIPPRLTSDRGQGRSSSLGGKAGELNSLE